MKESEKTTLNVEFENIRDKIVKELGEGNEINLKNTPKGLKVQIIKVSTLK